MRRVELWYSFRAIIGLRKLELFVNKEVAEMKSICFLGPAAFVWAVVILDGSVVAGPRDVEVLTPRSTIESKCRSAVRSEMYGPNCRQVYVYHFDDPCVVHDMAQLVFIDKVMKCIARGGPGRAAR
jgi:hypothetical protein